MKTVLMLICSLTLFLMDQAQALSLTSLNIEWYGRGGVISGNATDEYRDEHLKKFLFQELPPSDIYIFQEITAPEMLSKLFHEHECFTYESNLTKHQYILICAKSTLLRERQTEYAVQVGNPRLRAAPIATIETEAGERLSIAGLHLKAGRDDLPLRLLQVEALSKSSKLLEKSILIGDFNTFEGDEIEMNAIFQTANFTAQTPGMPTFLGRTPHTFDRAWSRGVQVKSINIYGPCNRDETPYPFNQYDHYQRFISDHCALRLEL